MTTTIEELDKTLELVKTLDIVLRDEIGSGCRLPKTIAMVVEKLDELDAMECEDCGHWYAAVTLVYKNDARVCEDCLDCPRDEPDR